MDKRWYIVHAYSNFEKKVAESIREQAKQRGLEDLFERVLVPTEKDSPTVRVEVRLPTGIEMIAVEAKPGWEGRYEPFPVGASRVEWTGGRIPSGAFVSFEFLAWNPPKAGVLEWQATQWYEDGTNDRWGAGDDHHKSRTTLKPSTTPKAGLHRHAPTASKP